MEEWLFASDGVKLKRREWRVDSSIVTVALCHGYGEHAGRYAHVGARLNQHSISLVGADLRGHGLSDGERGYVQHFSDYHRDLEAILIAARRCSGNGQIALLAHSLGGLIACDWLLSRGESADLLGLVISSPFLGLTPSSELAARMTRPLTQIARRLSVPANFSGKDLCRDPEMVQRRDEDPLVNRRIVLSTITDALNAAEVVCASADRLATPTLLLYAGSDWIVSAESTERFAEHLRMPDRTAERLPGFFHEILNEPAAERDRIIDRIAAWLVKRAQ